MGYVVKNFHRIQHASADELRQIHREVERKFIIVGAAFITAAVVVGCAFVALLIAS